MKQASWQGFLEATVFRIQSLLDDMISTENVSRDLNVRSNSIRKSTEELMKDISLRSIDLHDSRSSIELMKIRHQEDDQTLYLSVPSAHHRRRHHRVRTRDKEMQEDYEFSLLEKQESLLFHVTRLLKLLVADSARIREFLHAELKFYLPSIITMMNIICPSMADDGKVDRLQNDEEEYQRPKYGFTDATWSLIVQSRRMIHDLAASLGVVIRDGAVEIIGSPEEENSKEPMSTAKQVEAAFETPLAGRQRQAWRSTTKSKLERSAREVHDRDSDRHITSDVDAFVSSFRQQNGDDDDDYDPHSLHPDREARSPLIKPKRSESPVKPRR